MPAVDPGKIKRSGARICPSASPCTKSGRATASRTSRGAPGRVARSCRRLTDAGCGIEVGSFVSPAIPQLADTEEVFRRIHTASASLSGAGAEPPGLERASRRRAGDRRLTPPPRASTARTSSRRGRSIERFRRWSRARERKIRVRATCRPRSAPYEGAVAPEAVREVVHSSWISVDEISVATRSASRLGPGLRRRETLTNPA